MMHRFRAAAVGGLLVSAIGLAVLVGAASRGGDAKPATPAEPERFQYLRAAASDSLFDTATGKVYVPSKGPERKWEILVEAPADLPAEASKAPRPRRFQYQPYEPARLVDTATGKAYELVDSKGGKAYQQWSPVIQAPAE
jgi:hypothetical protein